jgi:hypothetical protein
MAGVFRAEFGLAHRIDGVGGKLGAEHFFQLELQRFASPAL